MAARDWRDTRVRWALEEVGQEPAHCALHPFGQIPTYEEGDLALFESGAIKCGRLR
jgi:glutathione S-transferase